MNTQLLFVAVAAFSGGAAIALTIALGKGEYLIDAGVALAALPFLRPEAILLLLAIQFAARRAPYVAVAFADTLQVHPLLVGVLFPGAIMPDSSAAMQPAYDARIMASGKRRARDRYGMEILAKRIRANQEKARRYAGIPFPPTADGIPPPIAVTKVDADDADTIAKQLAAGKTVSQIAQSLPGYHPRKYREFVARVEAVAATIQSEVTQ